MRLILTVIGVFVCFLGSVPIHAAAGINEQINYQGRLLTASGRIAPDGLYNMEFKIYQDGNGCVGGGTSPCGGTLKWTEDWVYGSGSPDNRVRVVNGYFSVRLGSITAFGSSVDWNQDTLWLSMNVGNQSAAGTFTAASPDGEMLPFKRLSAAPYAMQAKNASNLNGLADTGFIKNQTTTQANANFNIQSAAAASVGGVIQGAAGQTANLLEFKDSAGTALAGVAADGRVGIGTAAPSTKLHVYTATPGSAVDLLRLQNNGSTAGTGTGILFGSYNYGTANIVATSNPSASYASTLLLTTRNAANTWNTGVNIDATGQVGIQVTAPSSTLDVGGTVEFSTLGTANTASLLCRNASNQVAGCTTTGTGAAWVQGGNTFGATGILGTQDANALNIITNNTNRISISAGGQATFTPDAVTSAISVATGGTGTSSIFIGSAAGYIQKNLAAPGQNAFVSVAAPSTAGTTTQSGGNMLFGTTYWNGAVSTNEFINISPVRMSTTPGDAFLGVNNSLWVTQAAGSSSPTITAVGATGQTSNMLQITNAAASSLLSVSSTGATTIATTASIQGSNALTLGLASTNTGAILFKGSGTANTLTFQGPTSPTTNTITLPNETGTVCTTGSVCTGYAPASGSTGYIRNQTTLQANANFNIQSAAAGSIGGVIQGASGQTANLLEFRNSAGTFLTGVAADGKVGIGALNAGAGLNVQTDGTSMLGMRIYNPGTGADGRSVIRFTSDKTTVQSYDVGIDTQGSATKAWSIRDATSAGAPLRLVVDTGGNVGIGNTSTIGAHLQVLNAIDEVGVVVQGAAGQANDLLQLKDGTGAALATVGSTGILTLNTLGATNTSTVLCRNASNQVAGCTTTGTGAAWVQGGNSFGATGVLGTNDANSLALETNNVTRLTIDTNGNANFTGTVNTAATGGYYLGGAGSPVNVELTRTIPTVVNDYVEIGNFNLNNGAHNFRIAITNSSSAFSLAKAYTITALYDQTAGAWQIATPTSDTGAYVGQNYALDINVAGATASLRLRRTAGATAGTAKIRVESVGETVDVFTATAATGSATAPTVAFGSGGYLVQVPGTTAANTITPTAASVVGLTINGTSGTATTALNVVQSNGAAGAAVITQNATGTGLTVSSTSSGSGQYIGLSNNTGTQSDGLLIERGSGAGTTTDLLHLSNVTGTVGDALHITGTYTNLIEAPNLVVTNAGLINGQTITSAANFTGTLAVTTLGTANTATQLCRNASNQVAGCTTTGTGAAWVQGGNSFGATGVLGTNDANSLTFETNNVTQATIAVGGATTFKNSANSTAAFAVQNAAASSVLVVDTTNSHVGINTAAANATLDLLQSATGTVGLLVTGAATSPTANYVTVQNGGGNPVFEILGIGGRVHQGDTVIAPKAGDSLGTVLAVQSGTLVDTMSIGLTGAATFQNSTNSTLAFRVLNAAGTTNLIVADTTNNRVGIGVTAAPATTLQVGGIATIDTLGTANTANYVCRNATNQLATCTTTGTGAAWVQGGNSFGATGVLGTNDSNNLTFETNGVTQATIAVGGAATFQNSTDISSAFKVATAGGTTLLNVNTLSTGQNVTLNAPAATSSSIYGNTTFLQSAKNVVTAFIGSNESTIPYTANESSGNLRFNGSGTGWGDFGYYPNGGGAGNYGQFRLSTAGSAITTTPNAKLGVGNLYAATNIGVNTLSPGAALDVNGSAIIQGSSALTLGLASTNTGAILFKGSGSANTLTFQGPTSPTTNTITLPNETGTVCTTGSVCTGYAAASGSGNYIQNQTGVQQPTSGFWISGVGRVDGNVLTPALDTAQTVPLNIGTNNATVINLNENTTVATGKNVNVTSGVVTQGGYEAADAATNNMLVNGDFERGDITGWSGSGGTMTAVAGGYSGNYAAQITAGSQAVLSDDYIPVDPVNDVLQLEGYFKKTVTGSPTPGVLFFGYKAYTAAKVEITTAPCGTYCYFAAAAATIPADSAWHKYSATTTGEGTVFPNFPVGTKYVRVLGLINNGASGNEVTLMDHITLRRVNNGPLFVGNNYNATNMVDQYQAAKLYTTTGNVLTLDASGGVNVLSGNLTVTNLGTTNTSNYLCRNASLQIAACSTTGTGASWVQGGNSFGATGVLGTNDANSLVLETNNVTQATIAVGGATTFKNSTNSTAGFAVQNAAGTSVFAVDTTNGQTLLGTNNSLLGKLVFGSSGSANPITLQGQATAGAARIITLPDENGTVCTTGSVCTGYAPASGSGSYIRNQTNQQIGANFNIQSAAIGNVGGVIQGFSGQTADLLDLRDGAGTLASYFTANGSLRVGAGSSAVAAFGSVAPTAGRDVSVRASATSNVSLTVAGTVGQTADILEVQDGVGTNMFVVSPFGSAIITPQGSGGGLAINRIGAGTGNGQYWQSSVENAGNTDALGLGMTSTTYTTGGALASWLGNSQSYLYYPSNNGFKIGTGTTATAAVMAFDNNGYAQFQGSSNTTSAFSVYNSSHSLVLNVDTTNLRVGVAQLVITNLGTADTSTVLCRNSSTIVATCTSVAANAVPLSGLTSATATDTLANANFTQTWNWATASTQSAFVMSADTLTSGTGLAFSSASTGLTGNVASFSSTGAGAGVTGNVLALNMSGASNAGNTLKIDNACSGAGTAATGCLSLLVSTGAVHIGDGTNYMSMSSTTHEPLLAGTARHTKVATLAAEYAGSVLDASGSNNSGTMTAPFSSTAGFIEGYYNWTTSVVTPAQSYDVVVNFPLPSDWSAWNGSTPITIDTYSTATGTSTIAGYITDTAGTAETAWSAAYNCALTPASNSTWTTKTGCAIAGTYAANGTMSMHFRMTAINASSVRIGTIKLNYLSKY